MATRKIASHTNTIDASYTENMCTEFYQEIYIIVFTYSCDKLTIYAPP